MKRKIITTLILIILLTGSGVYAAEYKVPKKIRATYYTAKEGSITYSGDPVRKGIVAGKKEWLGKVAILYDEKLNMIGYYEFKDIGGNAGLKNGTRIDIFMESDAEGKDFVKTYGDYVYLEIIEAEG